MSIELTLSETSGARIPIEMEAAIIEVPAYSLKVVPELRCAKYARLAAEELFGKKFTPCHAWDRIYNDRLVATLNKKETLRSLVGKNILEEGMIIGVKNPESRFLADKDQDGKPIRYTHNSLYLGKSPKHQPLFACQFEDKVFVRTEQELRNDHLTPIEVFDEPISRSF
jgi:hypothetical protein